MPIRPIKRGEGDGARAEPAAATETPSDRDDIRPAPRYRAGAKQPRYNSNGERVGKNVTPEDTRWKKGQSGNPSGRGKPKPPVDAATAIIELMEELVAVSTAKGKRTYTHLTALMRKTYELAVKGNVKAIKLLIDLYTKAKAQQASNEPQEGNLTSAEEEALKAMLRTFGLDDDDDPEFA